MPLNGSEMALEPHISPGTGVSTLPPVESEADIVYPVYIWQLNKPSFLTKKEFIACETFLRTRNYSACVRAVEKEVNYRTTIDTVKGWLEHDESKQYMLEKMEERGVAEGWTRERWMLFVHDHMIGKKKLSGGDLYCLKLIAGVKGFNEADMNVSVVNQINFTQASGKA